MIESFTTPASSRIFPWAAAILAMSTSRGSTHTLSTPMCDRKRSEFLSMHALVAEGRHLCRTGGIFTPLKTFCSTRPRADTSSGSKVFSVSSSRHHRADLRLCTPEMNALTERVEDRPRNCSDQQHEDVGIDHEQRAASQPH